MPPVTFRTRCCECPHDLQYTATLGLQKHTQLNLRMDTIGIIGLTLCGVGLIGMSFAMVYHHDPDRRPQGAEGSAPPGWAWDTAVSNSPSMGIRRVSDDGERGVLSNYGTMCRSELRDGSWRDRE